MHRHTAILAVFLIGSLASIGAPPGTLAAENESPQVAEQVYQGELVAFPGPWGFLGKADIILVSDQELETIAADPDAQVNLAAHVHSAPGEPAADL